MKSLIVIALMIFQFSTSAQNMTVEEVVQANLNAYNANDINAFMGYFSTDIQLVNFEDGALTAQGIEEVRAIYEPYFKASPHLQSEIKTRMVLGNKVIDYESITGRYGSDQILELILIYEVHQKKISKITVIRE